MKPFRKQGYHFSSRNGLTLNVVVEFTLIFELLETRILKPPPSPSPQV